MSLPRASDIATGAGITQSYVQPKTQKVDKKAEEARLKTLHGDDEEGDGGPQAGPRGAGKSGGAAAAKFGQDERQKVKRKRVKLSELTSKKTGASKPKAEAAQTAAKEAKAGNVTPEEIGRKVAQQRLNEQGKLAETRYLYQQKLSQSNKDPNNALSPQARQKRMLNSLISYQQNNYMQHTGDKAGEIYNRPATRQILQALQGLKSAPSSADSKGSNSTSTSSNTSPAAFKAKSEQANKMLEVFMRADTQPPPGYEPTELVA